MRSMLSKATDRLRRSSAVENTRGDNWIVLDGAATPSDDRARHCPIVEPPGRGATFLLGSVGNTRRGPARGSPGLMSDCTSVYLDGGAGCVRPPAVSLFRNLRPVRWLEGDTYFASGLPTPPRFFIEDRLGDFLLLMLCFLSLLNGAETVPRFRWAARP
jgi:hypothetical protein